MAHSKQHLQLAPADGAEEETKYLNVGAGNGNFLLLSDLLDTAAAGADAAGEDGRQVTFASAPAAAAAPSIWSLRCVCCPQLGPS